MKPFSSLIHLIEGTRYIVRSILIDTSGTVIGFPSIVELKCATIGNRWHLCTKYRGFMSVAEVTLKEWILDGALVLALCDDCDRMDGTPINDRESVHLRLMPNDQRLLTPDKSKFKCQICAPLTCECCGSTQDVVPHKAINLTVCKDCHSRMVPRSKA